MATTNSIASLLSQIADANLRGELSRAVEEVLREKKFGLVFEEHLPEVQELTGIRIRKGTRVSIQGEPLNCTYRVEAVEIRGKTKWAKLRRDSGLEGQPQEREINLTALIPVARYGEAIYPSLKTIERVERAPDKPFHSIINSDNYHALQLLLYGYKGAFDVIYIDPPYNTGARDWKYNNDYIDKNDRFRHSKWLSMMKKRLLVAKELLAHDGVLVVAIDENELIHLGMLLEHLFPKAIRQLVTVVINPKGVTQGKFSRVEEHLIFCFMGNTIVKGRGDDFLTAEANEEDEGAGIPRWKGLLRSGTNARREDRKRMFFPVLIDKKRGAVVGAGETLPFEEQPDFETLINGLHPVWPVRTDGSLGNWGVGATTLRQLIEKGYVSLGAYDSRRNTYGISYLSRQSQEQIAAGVLEIISTDKARNTVEVRFTEISKRQIKTVWHRSTHDAGAYGSTLVKQILGRNFPFPKSLYAVRDALSAIIRDKPDALILDFFAGSGTTLHATLLLNAEDDGNRRCVLVTNNEVSEAEERVLAGKKLKRGDEEWEKEGICRAVTIPRCKYAINGRRDDGTELGGKYLSGRAMKDGFEANLQAFSLDFLDPLDVARGGKFEDIAPILWLLAGAKGDLISPKDIADKKRAFIWPNGSEFLVSRDDRRFGEVLQAVESLDAEKRAQLRHIFLVTNSREAWLEWREAFRALAPDAQVHQLYRDYLENYRLGENRLLTDESLVAGLDEEETA